MKVFESEPVAKQGYWRVGGPMDRFVIVESEEELLKVYPEVRYVIGNGSNLLVPDAGLRGLTIRVGIRSFEVLEQHLGQVRVRVGAGLPNAVLLSRVAKLGWSGVGCLAGVPGTLGGAVAMNAGTALGEIEAVIEQVEGVGEGGWQSFKREELSMSYREGGLKEGFVVSAAILKLSSEESGEAERIAHHLERRKATQPLELPSCGSVFRNPPGDYAGRLIEACGLKGFKVGGAQVSPKHGNFIVNTGEAKASEVMAVIQHVWETVGREQGVWIVPEVRVLGEW
jgi:UDP-N-acetylmuramate dehydrogenase